MAAVSSASTELSRRRFTTSDGVSLSVVESGPRDAKVLPIALVTGWSMPASLWEKQLAVLGTKRRVIALDPRGQGESDVPRTGYTAERRATDIEEFLKPLPRVVLVGWSLGVLESLQYVRMFGEDRLAGLVLIDNSVGEEPAPRGGGPSFTAELRQDRAKSLRDFAHAIFKTPRTEAEIDQVVASASRMRLEDSIALLSYPFPRTYWRDILRGFSKPVLYIVTPQYEAQARNLEKNRPGTQVAVFSQAGHALFVDDPDRFNTLLEEFVEKLPAR
jgi:microsomal epoxide hydrolase